MWQRAPRPVGGRGQALEPDFPVTELWEVLTERCVELVDTAAGLMLDDQRGHLQVIAYTHESARLIELFELQRAEGPCLDCFATGQVIANVDLADSSSRWPVFTEGVLSARAASA